MTNFLVQHGEDNIHRSSSDSPSDCMQASIGGTAAANLSINTENEHVGKILVDIPSGLSNFLAPTTQPAVLEPDSDGVSDEGTHPLASSVSSSSISASVESHPGEWIYLEDFGPCRKPILGLDTPCNVENCNKPVETIKINIDFTELGSQLSEKTGNSCRLHEEKMNHEAPVRDCDGGGGFFGKDNPLLVDTRESKPSPGILIDVGPEDFAHTGSVGHCRDELCPVTKLNEGEELASTVGLVSLAQCPGALVKRHIPAACVRGDLDSTVQIAPEIIQIMPEARGSSSSHASIMHSDDENVQECQKGRCKMVFRDLEAGLPSDNTSSVDEEGMHDVELFEDCKATSLVEISYEAVSLEAYGHHAASCDVKALVDSELREPLLAHVQTDDTKSSQDKEILQSGENKLVGDSPEKEAEVHGLRKRRGAKVEAVKPSIGGDSCGGKMPEEEKRGVTATRTKDASADSSQETKQKPVDKKTGKQAKVPVKPPTVRRVGDSQPSEELRAKDEAETNRKVHESLDNFIRQTIRCEPYMNFTGRPGDKPLQRLRSDVFENHVAGKFARGYKVDNGSDPRDSGTEESLGMDGHSGDADGLKDASNSSAKGIAGLGRGSQHSLKVPPGVVAFTQAASKGTDLQGWLSPSKVTMTKCEKCTREFCSTLNYRRHVRIHRRSMNPEKEDLSKERSKVAAFWDKLTPEEANSIVHYENMEIEDLSGQSAFKALTIFIQQPGLPSLPQAILKAGALLLDIAQNKSAVFPLSSERLLNILDEASEKTFLCGGTSVAVQRFVFNGDAGKVGLEEKNLVASMGFHIELKLVKAWMADKEAEALRCQQALFKEEEAAQQKRTKLLEKKRMKKIRQKERKGSASQLVQQELENESIDEESNIQGIGEEGDSPTATGSSSSSLASVQYLVFPEAAELDMTEGIGQIDAIDEQVLGLGEEPATEKSLSRDEDSHDGLSQYGRERSQLSNHQESSESLYRTEDPSKESVMEKREGNSLLRPADQVAWDGDIDVRFAHASSQSRSGRAEVQSNRGKGDQERLGSDFKRREFDRPAVERKPLRTTRDRPRNDYSESVQKLGRDLRSFDGRYGEGGSQTTFKPLRKVNTYFVKGDPGNAESSNISRVQQYRTKPSGLNRALSTAGNAQVVWTRKVPQPAAVEATKDRKEDVIEDEAGISAVIRVDGWESSKVSQDVELTVSDCAGREVATKLDKGMEKMEDAASPVPLEVSTGNVIVLPTSSSTSVSFHVDVNSEDWPQLPQRSGSTYSLGTSLLTKSASFDSSAFMPMEEHVEFVSLVSEGDSGTIVGPCSDGSSGLMKTTLSSVRLQDSRLAESGDCVISAKDMPEPNEEGLSGALLVGSLSVPLGKFGTVSVRQARSGSYSLHPHQPDEFEATNISSAGSQDQSYGIPATQEVSLSLGLHSASGGNEGSVALGTGLDSQVRVPGARPEPIATQTAKLKPHVSLSSPERGDVSRFNASLPGHERLAAKQGSWQTSVGRYVSAKVWRAVGMVGERHDTGPPGLNVAGGDSASSFIDDRPLQGDANISGSESERETSPGVDVTQLSPAQEFFIDDSQERHDHSDDQALVVNTNICKDSDYQSFRSATLDSSRSVGSESDLPCDGKADNALSDGGVEAAVLESSLCTWSLFLTFAGTFLNERWRMALENASDDEVLVLATESVPEAAEGFNFLDRLRQLSNMSTRHHPGAESLPPSSSSVVAESLGNPAHDGGLFLSRIFSDSDQTGVEDVRRPLRSDERGLDGAAAQDSEFPQALSSEEDVAMREVSSSPVDSENYLSGSETSRSCTASSAPFGTDEQRSESRGGDGNLGSSHARRGNSRQERWNRNPRDRFPEQRYMPRRRAPVEKNW